MAGVIRSENDLPTIRASMGFRKGEPQVRLRAYEGGQELWDELIPAGEVGIERRLSVRAYKGVQFYLPEDRVRDLAAPLNQIRGDSPIWLQIDRSAGALAVVPWERLLAQHMPGPFLRIPNFLVDPTFVQGRFSLAVCASSPQAKAGFSVPRFVRELVEGVDRAVSQGTDIHVFADAADHDELREIFDDASPSVTVHDPAHASNLGTGGTDLSGVEQMRSPWLQWMVAELGGQPLDAVHFVCPGYLSAGQGSLALARSPLDNTDQRWSHFVGGAELRTFLDETGAFALALGAPHDNVWTLGLRLLADELAWSRPGPVLLYETLSNIAAVEQAYSFLFSDNPANPPPDGDLMLYCHPKRLRAHRHDSSPIVSGALDTGDPGHEWLFHTAQQVARRPDPILTPKLPDWARQNQSLMEQGVLDLSGQHGPSARGASDALKFLADLQERYLVGQQPTPDLGESTLDALQRGLAVKDEHSDEQEDYLEEAE